MTPPPKPRKGKLARILTVVAGLVVLIAVLELGVRITGIVPAPTYNRHVSWFTLPELPPEGLVLDENPPYIANELGFWTASPRLPGINDEGFRSPSFDEPAQGRPRVLILGDHFAYGMMARPYANSFADRLRQAGYQVFNLGVPDTGPRHYAALAEHYVPILEPDAVVVCFYTGNDYNVSPPLAPHAPLMYFTNVGALPARTPSGDLIEPEESYESWRRMFGGGAATRIRQFFLRSYLLGAVGALVATEGSGFAERDEQARAYLTAIRDVAEAHGAAYLLTIIPVSPLYATGHNSLERAERVFADLDPLGPSFLGIGHYEEPPQAYFNNEGHKRFGEWLDEHLRARGLEPRPDAVPAAESRELPRMHEGVLDWEAFRAALDLTTEQALAVRPVLDRLQDDLHDLFLRPTADGQPSPGAWLAARSPAPAELAGGPRDSAFVQYVSRERLPDGRTYGAAFAERERAAREALAAHLGPEQQERFRDLGLDSLLRVDTGYDPFGDAVLALSEAGAAP